MSLTLSGDSPKISADSTGVITSGTAVTASGTQVNFTGIPSWVKRITVMFNGVSTNGTSQTIIQLGDSGGIENTGYNSAGAQVYNSAGGAFAYTTGFGLANNISTQVLSGSFQITNFSGNIWVISGNANSPVAGAGNLAGFFTGGNKELSATLDRIRITNVNGTDTFDAGSINILYE